MAAPKPTSRRTAPSARGGVKRTPQRAPSARGGARKPTGGGGPTLQGAAKAIGDVGRNYAAGAAAAGRAKDEAIANVGKAISGAQYKVPGYWKPPKKKP